MSAVCFDAIRRYLEFRGYLVDYICNFTDVDDKIIRRAEAEKVESIAVAERFIASYLEDMDRLNVKRATMYPRATTHIPEMLALIQRLVDNGTAYPVDGDVYYDVTKFAGYGKLSGRKVPELQAGARVEADSRLRHPADFALWKSSKPGEPSWDSPWGPGRPGWHIECSAMSTRYLGDTFDIHGGGLDLVFPHHENEIAQAEAATGKPFAMQWLHNGILNLGGAKMSKSIGNVLGLKLLFEKHPAEALRHYILGSHYRSPQNYEDGALDKAERAHSRFDNVFERLDRALAAGPASAGAEQGEAMAAAAERATAKFHECMSEDFNTAGAIGALFELAGELNSALQEVETRGLSEKALAQAAHARAVLAGLLGVLGFRTGQPRPLVEAQGSSELAGQLVQVLVDLRLEARKSKNFALADGIRQKLAEVGVELKDTATGTTFKLP
jgi:cysteinyl-tRNA synthetase